MKQLLLDIRLPAVPSLVNFVPGSNLELVQMLKRILVAQEKERFVYIWGKIGCGKSHLLQAVVENYIQKDCKAWYFSGEITKEFRLMDDLGCVAVDDVERLDSNAQIELFNIYNQLRNDGNTYLLVSGTVAPSQ